MRRASAVQAAAISGCQWVSAVVQACLNGGRARAEHRAVPVTASQLARDAVAVSAFGVSSVHVHPRDAEGAETLGSEDVGAAVAAVRAAAPMLGIGATTGAWIEPDPRRRAELVARWARLGAGRPDFASVNVHEAGWPAVCDALARAGIGIELGVFDESAAAALRAAGGVPPGTVRVLAEVQPTDPAEALDAAAALLDALTWLDGVPVLLHGQDGGAWPVLRHAVTLGLATRLGLEDTLLRPGGTPATGNAALFVATEDHSIE